MVATDLKNASRGGAYWRELLLGRLFPAIFFSVFVAGQAANLSTSVGAAHTFTDYLFVLRQLLALAYFTMLVLLYAARQPARGTDHRLAVIAVAFTGTFSAIVASFLPGSTLRPPLILPGDILATAGLAYSVWGLAYLRRSFSIIPEARRLVTGGPYGLSRHPVYLGEIATAIGVNLATAGWLAALTLVYFVGAELLRMRWEERILSQTFPDDYPAYAARVPRYLPNPLRPAR